jgi:transposase-like protein
MQPRHVTATERVCRRRTGPDWARIEAEYRDGAYSLREMARRHGCAHSSIANRASRHGWVRSERSRGLRFARPPARGERVARDGRPESRP